MYKQNRKGPRTDPCGIPKWRSCGHESEPSVTIQTDPEEVPSIMAWEVEAALRKMKNGKEAGKDQVNIETLKAGDETITKQLAKLYTKCITERRIPKTWKEANMVIFFKKGNRKDIKNYRPICLLSNMYKLCREY